MLLTVLAAKISSLTQCHYALLLEKTDSRASVYIHLIELIFTITCVLNMSSACIVEHLKICVSIVMITLLVVLRHNCKLMFAET